MASSVFMSALMAVDQAAISMGFAVSAGGSEGVDSVDAGGVAICALLSSS